MSQNIGSLLTKRAYRDPHLAAIYEPATGRRLNYHQLNERSNRVANALKDTGVLPGDRVGLLMMNSAEFVESFFAVAKIGGVNVPLNWRLVADELEFILADAGATVLICSEEFTEVAAELRERGDATGITTWVKLGETGSEEMLSYSEWTAAAATTEPDPGGSGDDLLFIMYTSGTTGLPKGVMHTHETVLWATLTISATAEQRHGDVYLCTLPMFHVGALTPLWSGVLTGQSFVVVKEFDPTLCWELIRDEQVTITLMVPAMLQFMLAVRDDEVHNSTSLRWVMSGAAPVPVSLIESYEALEIEIHQVYGLTESCGPGCLLTSEDASQRAGSTGKAFYFTEVRVVDPEGTDCAPGEPGQVILRGPHVMKGYWNRPDATAEVLVDGWLQTGDIGTMDKDGYVSIVDRLKDMLISGGENVYPAEIENLLLSHDKVADAGVIGITSEKWGESPLAVVVRADATLTADDLIEFCRGKLAPFKAVRTVEFVPEIPRNPSGKILKRELRKQFDYAAPE